YMLKYNSGKKLTVAEAESSSLDGRNMEPGVSKVGCRNVRNQLGVDPAADPPSEKDELEALGFPFVYLSSVVEAALHNPNLIVHAVGAIMSMPRIEKTNGDYVMYHEVLTPSIWNILEKLDSEKMDVLEKLGFPRLSY